MTVFQAIILGIIQGVTELLPVSSSAHLILIPLICGWSIPESFDVALHFGTLIAIVAFFHKDWLQLIRCAFKENCTLQENKMFWYIIFATIPGGIIGFCLDHIVGDAICNMPLLIAFMLIAMGIVLYFVDKYAPTNTEYEDMNFKQTFLIGLSQAIAFIPGVSRSGITMTAGRLLGISRESAAKYSFMLSTPIIFGATIYKFKDFVFDMPFVVGVITSAVSSMLVIRFLLDYLKKGSFKAFAVYRLIIGIAIILMLKH